MPLVARGSGPAAPSPPSLLCAHPRTAPFAWSGWSRRLAMRACFATRVCGRSSWAAWAAAATCATCCVSWPCIPTATRWAVWGGQWRGAGTGAGRGRDPWGPHHQPPLPQDGSLQCPTCKAIYGEKTGTQPPGKMEFHLIPHSLPGFADTQTIRIVYDIPTGIQVNPLDPNSSDPSRGAPPQPVCSSSPCCSSPQGPEHPNPGKKFTARGFPRHCYLPNNEKGRKVGALS